MDQTVSRYEKLKTGQQNPLKNIERSIKRGGKINYGTRRLLRQYRYIQINNASFRQKTKYLNYFNDEVIKNRAIFVFFPYLRKWNYSFPSDWQLDNKTLIKLSKIIFRLEKVLSIIYWRYFRK